jgi:ABC-2 type transport system ATP-binding protein
MNIRLKQAVVRKQGNGILLGPIDAVFEAGLIGLIGSNGAGKSLLLKVITQVITVSSGTVSYEEWGIPLTALEARLLLGYVPQDISLYEEMTLRHYLKYIAGLKCIESTRIDDEITSVCEMFDMSKQINRRLGHCSIWEQRKAMIAQAFLGRPQYILLDEPFVGLDIEQRQKLLAVCRSYAEEAVVIVASHFVEEMRLGEYNRIVQLRNGCIVADDEEEVGQIEHRQG